MTGGPNNRSLFANLAEGLSSDWRQIARPNQLTPPGAWIVWLILAGRGFGKTRTGAETVRLQKLAGSRNIGLIAATAADCRDVMIEGPSGLLTISPLHDRPLYEPSKRRLTWKSGAIATAYSADEPDRLRGPAHDFLWCDELAAWNDPSAWDQAMFGLRMGKNPRAIVTTTPRPTKIIKGLVARDGQDVHVTRGSTFENAANLAPAFLNEITKKYQGTRLGRQELDAELLEDTPGALWTRQLLEDCRIAKSAAPAMRRIVVAIDPAVSVSETSDETGIVVMGLGDDGHGYVLADDSGKWTPIEWARRAVTLYHHWQADRIVAEANQGGLMVEQTIRTVDANVSFKSVIASRGKVTRAEPIAALFEQGRCHLVGGFAELEDQLCSFAAGSSDSPDRLDAVVWGFTELMIEGGEPAITAFYREEIERAAAEALRPSDPIDLARIVVLQAPEGCSVLFGINGKRYFPDAKWRVRVPQFEVPPLERAGFTRITSEVNQ